MTSAQRGSTKQKRGILAFFNEAPTSKVDNHSVENAPTGVVQVDVHHADVPTVLVQRGGGSEISVDEPIPTEATQSPRPSPAVDDEPAPTVEYESDHRNENGRQQPSVAKGFRSVGLQSSTG